MDSPGAIRRCKYVEQVLSIVEHYEYYLCKKKNAQCTLDTICKMNSQYATGAGSFQMVTVDTGLICDVKCCPRVRQVSLQKVFLLHLLPSGPNVTVFYVTLMQAQLPKKKFKLGALHCEDSTVTQSTIWIRGAALSSYTFFLFPFSSTPEKKRKIPSQNCTWSKKGQSKKGSEKSTSKIQKKEREKSNTKHARERNTEKILLHFFPPSSIVFLMYTIGPTTRVSDRPSS